MSAGAVVLVNPNDRAFTRHRYVLAFGAYGWTRLMVWADSVEDALDESVDWIAEHAPGLLCDDAVRDEYLRCIADGMTEEEAAAEAETDTTCAGNAGHYLPSWEWTIVAEDPSRDEVLAILGRTRAEDRATRRAPRPGLASGRPSVRRKAVGED